MLKTTEVLLGTLPDVVRTYEDLGGNSRSERGWSLGSRLRILGATSSNVGDEGDASATGAEGAAGSAGTSEREGRVRSELAAGIDTSVEGAAESEEEASVAGIVCSVLPV